MDNIFEFLAWNLYDAGSFFPWCDFFGFCKLSGRRNKWSFYVSICSSWLFYRPPTKLREGNVVTCVCLSVHSGVPHVILPMVHWTSLYRTPPLPDMIHGDPQPQPRTPARDILWSSLETCSNLFIGPHTSLYSTPPYSTDIWCPLKHVQLASRGYASYWDASLFNLFFFKFRVIIHRHFRPVFFDLQLPSELLPIANEVWGR